MLHDYAGASEAQSDSGAAMTVVVNQELGSVAARNGIVFELEADAALSMRPNADTKRVGRVQERKIRVR